MVGFPFIPWFVQSETTCFLSYVLSKSPTSLASNCVPGVALCFSFCIASNFAKYGFLLRLYSCRCGREAISDAIFANSKIAK